MFRLIGRELGAECWLLTPTGRVVGGTRASLPRPVALGLACEFLKADRLPTEVTGLAGGTGEYSLFGVGGEPPITSWFLACAGRERDWPHELRESVAELAAVQGKPVDIGGYYMPDVKKVTAVMRPSATFNAVLESFAA